jgi:hypothetical protein
VSLGVLSSTLKNGINSEDEIIIAIDFHSQDLSIPFVQAGPLLSAIAFVESDFGKYDIPRYEPAFGLGGLYYHKSPELRAEYQIYGPLVACSYSPWQIMFSTAKQMGYLGHPLDLWPCANALPYVIDYLNFLYLKRGATSLEKIAQAYNSGGCAYKPTPQVQKYIEKVLKAYQSFVLKYQKGKI